MVHSLLSPRGVDDVFQVVDRTSAKHELNNSFSWVDDSKPVQKGDIRTQIERVQKRLEWLEEQKLQDKLDYQDRLREAKMEYRARLERAFAPTMESLSKNNKEKMVLETQKIIQYLRDDNSKVRSEMNVYKKQIEKMKKENEQLEKTNQKVMATCEELANHVAGLEAVQAKLQDNCNVFKQALQDMKSEYKRRNDHFNAELRSERAFEVCMAKVLAHVKNNSRSASLVEDAYQIAAEGGEAASKCRNAQLSKFGLVRETVSMNYLDLKNDKDDSDSEWDSDSDDE